MYSISMYVLYLFGLEIELQTHVGSLLIGSPFQGSPYTKSSTLASLINLY